MLKTSDDEVIADRNISAESGIQDSCIEPHDVESQITNASVTENFNQLEAQNSDIRQLKSQLAGELINQSLVWWAIQLHLALNFEDLAGKGDLSADLITALRAVTSAYR